MSVFSIAAPFFDVCPSDNTPLPFTAFPALTYNAPKAKRDWQPWTSSSAPAKTTTKSEAPKTTEYKDNGKKTTEYNNGSKTTEYKKGDETSTVTVTVYPSKQTDNNNWNDWNNGNNGKPGYENGKPSPAKTSDCPAPPAQWEGYGKGGKGPMPAPVLPKAGDKVSFTSANDVPAGSFITFVSGLVITSVPASIDGKTVTAAIPDTVSGQTYVFLSSSDQEKTFSDKAVLAGPAIIEVAPPAPAIDYNYKK